MHEMSVVEQEVAGRYSTMQLSWSRSVLAKSSIVSQLTAHVGNSAIRSAFASANPNDGSHRRRMTVNTRIADDLYSLLHIACGETLLGRYE